MQPSQKPFLLLCLDESACKDLRRHLPRDLSDAYEIIEAHRPYFTRFGNTHQNISSASPSLGEEKLIKLALEKRAGVIIADENTDEGASGFELLLKAKPYSASSKSILGFPRENIYTFGLTGTKKAEVADKSCIHSDDGAYTKIIPDFLREKLAALKLLEEPVPSIGDSTVIFVAPQINPPPPSEPPISTKLSWLSEMRIRDEKGDEPPGGLSNFADQIGLNIDEELKRRNRYSTDDETENKRGI